MVPFLKWVGGKRQLLDNIRQYVPPHFERYIEPFVGGGAVFFDLLPEKAWINDVNSELVNCYCVVRDDVEALTENLSHHIYDKDYYLAQRALDRVGGGLSSLDKLTRASRFIYLNRTAFNGMYRVNSKGLFNVPFGRYKNPNIVNEETLRACSSALQQVKITNLDYLDVLSKCKERDFVYVDPPYFPVSPTASFTQYSDGAFGLAQQQKLAEALHELHNKGVKFLASNANVPDIFDLYQGFAIKTVLAKRAINSKADKRHAVKEVLISNM